MTKTAIAGGFVAACGLALGWWVYSVSGGPPPQAITSGATNPAMIEMSTAALDRIYAKCSSEMLADTCIVMSSDAVPVVTSDKPVFVAGVGAIAASDYQSLYAAGDAMCSVVRAACVKDWNSSQCETSKKLWLR